MHKKRFRFQFYVSKTGRHKQRYDVVLMGPIKNEENAYTNTYTQRRICFLKSILLLNLYQVCRFIPSNTRILAICVSNIYDDPNNWLDGNSRCRHLIYSSQATSHPRNIYIGELGMPSLFLYRAIQLLLPRIFIDIWKWSSIFTHCVVVYF